MITTTRKKVGAAVGFVFALMCAASFTPAASAQTYYYPQYAYPYAQAQYTNAAEIQRLLNQVYALMAQLQALQAQAGYTYYTPSRGNTYTHTYTYNPSSKSYDIEVETTDVDNDGDDAATFYGEVDLDGASYANVWFEYGTDSDLDESTDDERIDDDDAFEMDVDDLDEDERYYVRAVAEGPAGSLSYGNILAFTTGNEDDDDDDDDDHNDDDIPEADTEDAENIDESSAELHGEIQMNDFEDGHAFFVYGEDEDAVADVEDEDAYEDIDEDGDDLQKFSLTTNLNDTRSFWSTISGLDEDTDYFFRICVGYEDEDGDDALECGDVESFTTDEN